MAAEMQSQTGFDAFALLSRCGTGEGGCRNAEPLCCTHTTTVIHMNAEIQTYNTHAHTHTGTHTPQQLKPFALVVLMRSQHKDTSCSDRCRLCVSVCMCACVSVCVSVCAYREEQSLRSAWRDS